MHVEPTRGTPLELADRALGDGDVLVSVRLSNTGKPFRRRREIGSTHLPPTWCRSKAVEELK